MKMLQSKIKNLKDLVKFSKKFLGLISINNQGSKIKDTAIVIGLTGPLGVGKTTFVRNLLKFLRIKQKIQSPSFLIIKSYEIDQIPLTHNTKYLMHRAYHIDAYRLNKSNELLVLGVKKIISNPNHIVLVEWADKVKKIMPKNTFWLNLEFGPKKNERKIKLSHSN